MPSESVHSPEPITEAIRALKRELGLLNINANFSKDIESPALITLDGTLDSTEPGDATDEQIELVVNKMKRDYNNFDFTYDKQGSIAVTSNN